MNKNETEKPSHSEQRRATVRTLVDIAVSDNRTEMSSTLTTRQLVRLDIYAVGFKGEKGSIHENRLDFISRHHCVVNVDGRQYQLPLRACERFIAEVKKALPDAKVERGDEIIYG